MKQIISALSFTTIILCCFCSYGQEKISYDKSDLQKLRWIEGNWSGLYQNKPFYEIYRFLDDSTLQITSYEWNGKDSSKSSSSYLRWTGGAFYLGDSLNWKVNQITDTLVAMLPHRKASNTIIWKRLDINSWDAILTTQKGETLYQMKRVTHFNN